MPPDTVHKCRNSLHYAKPRPYRSVGGLFVAGYGVQRFLVEFFREPDAHLGYIAFGWLTMGQLLCVPMIVGGFALMGYAYRHRGDTQAI